MPSSSKLTMLTLATIGDIVQISLSELVLLTGLSRPTVRTHLSALENDGWLKVERPDGTQLSRGERITYRLQAPLAAIHDTDSRGKIIYPRAEKPQVAGGKMTYPRGDGWVNDFPTPQEPAGQRWESDLHTPLAPDAPSRAGGSMPVKTPYSYSSRVSYSLASEASSLFEVSETAREAAAPQPLPAVAENQTPAKRRKPNSPVADSPEFVRFWSAYPRKQAKGAARTAWATHVVAAGMDVELVVSAAEFFGLTRAGQDPKFTPHASTWLNQQRWEDTPDPDYAEPSKRAVAMQRNLARVVESAQREGYDPMALLFPDSVPADHPDLVRQREETEAWRRGEPIPPRRVAPSAPEEARSGVSDASGGAGWGQARGQLF